MKNRIRHAGTLLLASLACISTAYAEPVVTPMADTSAASAAQLVQNLLGSNSALTVVSGSERYTGAASASGTFTNGGTNPTTGLGIDRGVVLSTGDARVIGSSAAFPGDDANKEHGYTAGVGNALTPNTSPGNALFDSLSPFGTANASILSFDFIPRGASLNLSLVFGSEDYNDLVNSGFPTDVFGVFVNGTNYATVPGSGLPISASTVNCGGPTSGPAPGMGGQNCGLYRDNAPFFGFITSELDGFTVAIDLSIPVNIGVVNTISFGIADALDSFGDSALLIGEGSIMAVPEPSTFVLALGALAAFRLARRPRAQVPQGPALV